MIKKISTLLYIVGLVFSMNAQIQTPQPSPAAKFEQTIGLTNVAVDYSRPAMRGRTIFGNLVPYGKLWRTGANMRTKIAFSDDVTIDGHELKSGTYAIFSIPNKKKWDVIFYTDSNGGGAPAKLDEELVALRISVKTYALSKNKESFTIGTSNLTNDSGNLYIAWEKTAVSMKIGVPSEEKTIKSIESVLAGPSANDYFQAAVYYLSSDKDMKQAKTWIDQAIDLSKKSPKFWHLRQQSLIYAKLGMKKEAISIAKTSLKLAEKEGNADYVKMNKESIAAWSK